MRIQIAVRGEALVNLNGPIFRSDAVPRVGEGISCGHLFDVAEKLNFPFFESKGSSNWVVEEVEWLFGVLALDMKIDVLVWATHPHLAKAIDCIKQREANET